jgi:NAD-dependent SIR2 family protein deacetylase
MPECQSCNSFVTTDYIRVFGTNGTVTSCPDCGNLYGEHGEHGP